MKIGIYFSYLDYGPGKVVRNLISGLEKNDVNYLENKEGDFNLILQGGERLNGPLHNCIIGPNICTIPIENSIVMSLNYKKIITPSPWVKKLYERYLPKEKIIVWPVGIDTNKFDNTINFEKKYDFLIYFKNRDVEELSFIKEILSKYGYTYVILNYGQYTETNFLTTLKNCKYSIILTSTESQGIAIQEIMSSNLPCLVWDVKIWDHLGPDHACESTSIPYWDTICGEFFYEKDNFETTLQLFLKSTYKPREYICENLSLDIMAEKIVRELTL